MHDHVPLELARHALDAVCSSAAFLRSPRHQRFLRYLVEESLAERLANLREIHIGVHIFGRSVSSFDPTTDTTVRVEARRLRARLARYYADEGSNQRLQIDVPAGSYVPVLRWRTATVSGESGNASLPVIAVLPIDALGEGENMSVWSDALTDELTDTLARARDIRVVARSSVMRFKSGRTDIRDIARSLAANVLIEGSLQQEGDTLRAIVQLIAANDGLHLWSEAIVGHANARFRFFDAVCTMVRQAVPIVLAKIGDHQTPPRPASKVNTALVEIDDAAIPEVARDAYERGRIAIRVRTTTSIARATSLFAEAARLAPQFARAHSALAASLLQEVGMTMRAATDAADAIRSAANQALEIDAELPEAHATLGMLLLHYEYDWPQAERAFLRAIRFGPSVVSAHRAYAFALMFRRRFDEADRIFATARELDPLDAQTRVHQGLLRFYQRRYAEAASIFEGMLDADPGNVLARTLLAAACLHSGDLSRAETLYRDTCDRHADLSIGVCGLAVTLARAGRTEEADAAGRALFAYETKGFLSPYQVAMVNCALGRHAAAIASLERAAAANDYNFQCCAVDPTFDPLHSYPEWDALMLRYGMPRGGK